jgi:glucokinase
MGAPVVGVDLGGTHLRAALVDTATGALLGAEVKRPVGQPAPEAVAELLVEAVRAADPAGLRTGVGVGVAAMLRGFSGVVVNAPNLGWREVDFRALLSVRLGGHVELYNDLKAIAAGEVAFGGLDERQHVAMVYVGTGVGAALIVEGKVDFGQSHLAGEFGHVKVVRGGRPCGCGMRGCLEAYASGRNLQLRVREELGAGGQTSRAVELAGSLEAVHAGTLDEAARLGDPYATCLLDEVADHLGTALANLVTLLNPSRLVMGGGVWQGCPELRRRTLEAFAAEVNAPALEGFRVVDSVLGDRAGVLGAAALLCQR